jgi:hypothetical protein
MFWEGVAGEGFEYDDIRSYDSSKIFGIYDPY